MNVKGKHALESNSKDLRKKTGQSTFNVYSDSSHLPFRPSISLDLA